MPEKVGLKAHQRDNLEYEFTVVLELDMKHLAKASKDRTGLFMGKPEFVPTIATGQQKADWCNQGAEALPPVTYESMLQSIRTSPSIKDLNALYYAHPQYQQELSYEFTECKNQLNNIVHQSNHQ